MQRKKSLFLGSLVLFAAGVLVISMTSNWSTRGQSATSKGQSISLGANRLGVQIGLTKPFTVPAAMAGHTIDAFLRVPVDAGPDVGSISAIKLTPKMVGNKLELAVYALSGDIGQVKSCKDWDVLKSTWLASYSLSQGEEITVKNVSHLGTNFRGGVLSFKIVPFPVGPEDTDCGCGRCGDLYCCPNPGACIGCATCGDVCCRKNQD